MPRVFDRHQWPTVLVSFCCGQFGSFGGKKVYRCLKVENDRAMWGAVGVGYWELGCGRGGEGEKSAMARGKSALRVVMVGLGFWG
jgi:hypothetical protein